MSAALERQKSLVATLPKTKEQHAELIAGLSRGRPPVSEDEGPSAVLRARVGAERVAKFKRLGGAAWLRKAIDKAKPPSPKL